MIDNRTIHERIVEEVCADCKGVSRHCPETDGPRFCEAYIEARKRMEADQ